MKRWLIALSALILSSCSADPVPNANIDQVVTAITAGATVIDVRTAEEMTEGMLPNAVPYPTPRSSAVQQRWSCPPMPPWSCIAAAAGARAWPPRRCRKPATHG